MKNKIFTFKISVSPKIYRTVEIAGDCSLFELAEVIIDSVNFEMDHAFGFYNNYKDIYESSEMYELLKDMPDGEACPGAKGVKKQKVCDTFEPKKKMAFLFDYGDDWIFLVECKQITEPLPKTKYPRVIEKIGEAPEQYADYGEDKE
jgi:hypothetical protein